MSIFTVAFIRAALERATKSAAQGAVLAFGAGQANVLDLDWSVLGGFAGGAFVLSLLTSIGSDALTGGTGPSLTNAEQLDVGWRKTPQPTFGEQDLPFMHPDHDDRGDIGVVQALLVVLIVVVILVVVGVL